MTEQDTPKDIYNSDWVRSYQAVDNFSEQEIKLLGNILTMEKDRLGDLEAVLRIKSHPGIFRMAAIDRLSKLLRDKQKPAFLALLGDICDPQQEEDGEVRSTAYGWRFTIEDDLEAVMSQASLDPSFAVMYSASLNDPMWFANWVNSKTRRR